MALRLIVPPSIEPVSTARAKLHLKEDLVDADNDAYIDELVRAAREEAEHRTQRGLMKRQWKLTLDSFPDAIRLRYPPVLTVDEVNYMNANGDWTALAPSSYQFDSESEPSWLVPARGTSWPPTFANVNSVEVLYTVGFSSSADAATARAAVPAALIQWILLAVGDMYSTRKRSDFKQSLPHDFADRLLDRWRVYG